MAAFPEIPYAHVGDGRECYSHGLRHLANAELKAELDSLGYVLEQFKKNLTFLNCYA